MASTSSLPFGAPLSVTKASASPIVAGESTGTVWPLTARELTIGRGDELKVTMSGGVATIFAPDDTIDALLKRADDALYRAKSAGRNQIEVDLAGFA